MLTFSYTFLGLIYSTFVPYLYDLIQFILCLTCIGPYYKFTVPLVKHSIIKNGPLNGVSYLYSVLLLGTTLSSAVKSLSLTLAVVVSSFTIFVEYVLTNLRLLPLTH